MHCVNEEVEEAACMQSHGTTKGGGIYCKVCYNGHLVQCTKGGSHDIPLSIVLYRNDAPTDLIKTVIYLGKKENIFTFVFF